MTAKGPARCVDLFQLLFYCSVLFIVTVGSSDGFFTLHRSRIDDDDDDDDLHRCAAMMSA